MLNTLLIPILDVEGASLGTAFAMLFTVIVTGGIMYRHLGILPWSKTLKELNNEP